VTTDSGKLLFVGCECSSIDLTFDKVYSKDHPEYEFSDQFLEILNSVEEKLEVAFPWLCDNSF